MNLITGIDVFSSNIVTNINIIEKICDYKFNTINTYITTMDKIDKSRIRFNKKKYSDAMGTEYNSNYIQSYIDDIDLLDFVLGCLKPEKSKRYNISQLYYHPFLEHYVKCYNETNKTNETK